MNKMKNAKKGELRIIGGKWKGKKIYFDLSKELRPTPDRAKEVLFNWLGQDLSGASCLDLFSGTGALGLEALSRGAKKVTFVEKNKEYVSASRIIGLSNVLIMFKHILPNILRPILVIATIGLALAIITESTLSFLGVGVPPTTPSLGTLIRFGNNFLFSGEWWITFFPAIFLVILALSINLLGDWMRDALNPKLKKR